MWILLDITAVIVKLDTLEVAVRQVGTVQIKKINPFLWEKETSKLIMKTKQKMLDQGFS